MFRALFCRIRLGSGLKNAGLVSTSCLNSDVGGSFCFLQSKNSIISLKCSSRIITKQSDPVIITEWRRLQSEEVTSSLQFNLFLVFNNSFDFFPLPNISFEFLRRYFFFAWAEFLAPLGSPPSFSFERK